MSMKSIGEHRQRGGFELIMLLRLVFDSWSSQFYLSSVEMTAQVYYDTWLGTLGHAYKIVSLQRLKNYITFNLPSEKRKEWIRGF